MNQPHDAPAGIADVADVAIVGGGIVGLATAYQFTRSFPGRRIVVVEKEDRVAAHQTGHNSGVIHSGLYYRPGSAKARLCVAGGDLMKAFCAEHGLPFQITGKVVVAVTDGQIAALAELHQRGTANGVPDLALIGPERLKEIEPHAAGVRALHVPHAAIVDYKQVAAKLAQIIRAAGGEVLLGTRVKKIKKSAGGLILETTRGAIAARYLVGCAGLHADRIARREGADPGAKIVPFRGEYYELVPERTDLVKGLIYPVPDARFPFLGVHFTRMIGGGVEAGPNAVLAWKREGYRKGQINLIDAWEVLSYGGFWKMAGKYWRTGWGEVVRSFSRRAFVRSLAQLVPGIRETDVHPGGSGVRAQALAPTGFLVDDFLIEERERALHVLNAPSPAATSSLAIGEEIVRRAAKNCELGA